MGGVDGVGIPITLDAFVGLRAQVESPSQISRFTFTIYLEVVTWAIFKYCDASRNRMSAS
jgi:hypothetical protein